MFDILSSFVESAPNLATLGIALILIMGFSILKFDINVIKNSQQRSITSDDIHTYLDKVNDNLEANSQLLHTHTIVLTKVQQIVELLSGKILK